MMGIQAVILIQAAWSLHRTASGLCQLTMLLALLPGLRVRLHERRAGSSEPPIGLQST